MLLKRLHRLHSSDPDENGSGVVDIEEEQEFEEIASEEVDSEEKDTESEEKADEQAESDELIVTIEGEQPEEGQEEGKTQNLPNRLRKLLRESERARRELEAKLSQNAPKEEDGPGEEPSLKDFDYDEDEFKAAFKEWTAKKAQAERRKEEIRRQQEEVAKEWEAVQQTYVKGKARFPKEKMAEAEEEVVSVLPANRQAMLMDMADDSAALVVALGSSPETLRKLASIKSDAKFVKELAKIEMNVKVQPKKTPPPPERTISGSGKTPGATAGKLDQLRTEAEKTGDYSKYFAEKRRLGK